MSVIVNAMISGEGYHSFAVWNSGIDQETDKSITSIVAPLEQETASPAVITGGGSRFDSPPSRFTLTFAFAECR